MTQPTTTEPDLTEAMEVWLRAVDTFTQAPVPHRPTVSDQAAARVIATALEARDAELRALKGYLRHKAGCAPLSSPTQECTCGLGAILTKQEPKS